jgi:pimeloyl-ACP methyl ester carboxylesterase
MALFINTISWRFPMKQTHIHLSDIHGYSRLVVDATLGVTNLVEAMHHTILRVPVPFGKPQEREPDGVHGAVYRVLQGASGSIYQIIRQITQLVGGGVEAAVDQLQPDRAHKDSSQQRANFISIVNGVLGDHMAQRNNPLTITMGFRQNGKMLELSPTGLSRDIVNPKPRLLVMLHGHCMNEQQWTRNGHNHGHVLAAANDCTPLFLGYNTGLHVSQNGRALADQLQALVHAWPVAVQEMIVVGYSMGGLLARSAFYYGEQAGHSWMQYVNKLLFVGTPHHGSMLERAGNLVDVALEASPYSSALARLGKIRSAGTTDLRHGNVIDQDWIGRDRFEHTGDRRQPLPLPANVQCYAIAAMLTQSGGVLQQKLVGDGLVPLRSALGQHRNAKRALHFAPERQKVFKGVTHFGLLDSRAVCAQLQEWIAQPN